MDVEHHGEGLSARPLLYSPPSFSISRRDDEAMICIDPKSSDIP